MPISIQEAKELLVEIIVTKNGQLMGKGTAFWININGEFRLITAAHVIWPSGNIPSSEVVRVDWRSYSAGGGQNQIMVHSHPNGNCCDYASIDFVALGINSPSFPFVLPSTNLQCDDGVRCLGFPLGKAGNFVGGQLFVSIDVGNVIEDRPLKCHQLLVSGSSYQGCSGGPVLKYVDEDTVSIEVYGLICGKPDIDLERHSLVDGVVILSSDEFT
mgnify:CR=1 FL=1|tara:strand:- start:34 stop:678 length:645 start_codon:yes stop_codon:yes gene_type:complete